jgi:hypothetical protein
VPRFLLAAVVALLASSGWSAAGRSETIHLIPDDRASFRPSSLFAWLRPAHNFGERHIEITSTPPGATLDLFYVRSNFQKRYEQTEAPARVILPKRMHAGPRDAVNIRAFAEGYRQTLVTIRVASKQSEVHVELEPLPNHLEAVSHTYFGGRGSLGFLTKESLQVRVQDMEGGFRVILGETAKTPDAGTTLDRIHGPLIESVESLQLGEDLMVIVRQPAGAGGVQLRSRQSRDELRDLYVYSVDMVPEDGGVEAVQEARGALAALDGSAVSACPLLYDAKLRAALDPAGLNRALAPRGAFTDPYLRAAMKRLGEISGGRNIHLVDGTTLNPASPIELSAAMSQPAEAVGYLALLRSFVAALEVPANRRATLHGLIAPEIDSSAFDATVEGAESAERTCLASR